MKSLGQLFEQFINESVLGKCVANVKGAHRPMIVMLAVAVLTESRKRMWDEDHRGLIADAARALVYQHLDGFAVYVRDEGTYRYVERNTLFERVVADVGVESSDLKRQIGRFLIDAQEENFELDDYVHIGGEVVIADHPMKSFVNKLNDLESEKKVAMRSNQEVRFRTQLFNLIRVGNAFFKRHEWQPRELCNVGEYQQRKLGEWKTGPGVA